MSMFPTVPGPYRMHTESGNFFFVVVETNRYKSGETAVHVFQPKRFRAETVLSRSKDDIIRDFGPTKFEPLLIFDAASGDVASDLQQVEMPIEELLS